MSVNRIRNRKSPFPANDWIMDSGAFTTLDKHGDYPPEHSVAEYAQQVRRWKNNGNMLAAVSQDYMCEPLMLAKTGLTVWAHQQLTVERYDRLIAERTGAYILPVLQGYEPQEYVDHIRDYGERLAHGAWVGVGSVCKRNGNPTAIEAVLSAIKAERPDLRLHGFGLKKTALASPAIRDMLETADSMAWSMAARKEGRGPDANRWQEAKAWTAEVLRAMERGNG